MIMRSSSGMWPLPLRLMLGIGFLYHGLPKLLSAEGHQGFAGMLKGIGVPAAELMAWVTGLTEVAGALALLAGAFVPIAAALLIVVMLVAALTVHLPNGFNFIHLTGMGDAGPVFGMPGVEVNLLYIAALLALAFGGAGAWSVDGTRAHREVPGV